MVVPGDGGRPARSSRTAAWSVSAPAAATTSTRTSWSSARASAWAPACSRRRVINGKPLRRKLRPNEVAMAVKEIMQLDPGLIEERFNCEPGRGLHDRVLRRLDDGHVRLHVHLHEQGHAVGWRRRAAERVQLNAAQPQRPDGALQEAPGRQAAAARRRDCRVPRAPDTRGRLSRDPEGLRTRLPRVRRRGDAVEPGAPRGLEPRHGVRASWRARRSSTPKRPATSPSGGWPSTRAGSTTRGSWPT